jgi:carbon monoxide dehydrogenase subunit G
MIVDQRVTINAPIDRAWDFLMDVPAVSKCVPGVESIEEIDKDNYIGALKVRVGPIGVKLEGKVTVAERDAEQKRAQLNVEAADRRIRGAVNGKTTMHLEEVENGTDLVVHPDVSILGKLGEFGQAVMRRKADQIVEEFAQNMAKAIKAGV